MLERPSGAGFPAVQPITCWQEAETTAAVWMRWLGHLDARTTPAGADGGVDVIADTALAQVKDLAKPVTRPELQRLLGADERAGRELFFFSSAGYTRHALEVADRVGIACFKLAATGYVEPANAFAAQRFAQARATHDGEEWVDPVLLMAKALTRVGHVLDVLIILGAALVMGYLKLEKDADNVTAFLIGIFVLTVGEGAKKYSIGDVPTKLL